MTHFFSKYPATATLVAIWVLVFLMMAHDQAALHGGGWDVRTWDIGKTNPFVSHRFGDMTPNEILQGQVWRVLTATLVHYGLFHLAINLIGMVQLGRMVEEWYGSAQAFLIYIAIGVGGNLFAVAAKLLLLPRVPAQWLLVRTWLGGTLDVPSAGGSVVVCGLVGLIGVVGWRSRTRFGNFVKGQMIAVLAFTALLGLISPAMAGLTSDKVPLLLDNLGHAGGALVGGAIGLLHRRLLGPAVEPPSRRWAGIAATILLVGSIMAQARAQRFDVLAQDSPPSGPTADRPGQLALAPQVVRERARLFLIYWLALRQRYDRLAVRPILVPDLAQRAFGRWAFRAGIPPHRTAITPPWPDTPEPLAMPEADRRALATESAQIIATLGRLGPPDEGTPAATSYAESLALIDRSAFIPPSAADFRRFRTSWQAVLVWADERMRAAVAEPPAQGEAGETQAEPAAPE